MVTAVDIVTNLLILGTALWGQFWRSKAKHYEGVLQQIVLELDAKEDIE